ncbi:MAG: hypothetical protein JW863_15490 [Chitinispirillaceae bacterium]|nr:hypothetical protein [Chitinispirillaceae bacterium]
MIRDPNRIVDELVSDMRTAFGTHLLGMVLYGSAVSHEFRPGKSDVNIALVLDDMSVELLEKGGSVLRGWVRRGMAAPLLFTPGYIRTAPADYPVEFLDLKHSYRMLFGDDPFSSITISRSGLRRQCRREFVGMVVQLRKEFIRYGDSPQILADVLEKTVHALLPLFKAIVLLHDRKIPNSKTELIAVVEDLFGLGASVISEVYNRSNGTVTDGSTKGFDRLLRIVENIAEYIGAMPEVPEVPVFSGEESPLVPVDR